MNSIASLQKFSPIADFIITNKKKKSGYVKLRRGDTWTPIKNEKEFLAHVVDQTHVVIAMRKPGWTFHPVYLTMKYALTKPIEVTYDIPTLFADICEHCFVTSPPKRYHTKYDEFIIRIYAFGGTLMQSKHEQCVILNISTFTTRSTMELGKQLFDKPSTHVWGSVTITTAKKNDMSNAG